MANLCAGSTVRLELKKNHGLRPKKERRGSGPNTCIPLAIVPLVRVRELPYHSVSAYTYAKLALLDGRRTGYLFARIRHG